VSSKKKYAETVTRLGALVRVVVPSGAVVPVSGDVVVVDAGRAVVDDVLVVEPSPLSETLGPHAATIRASTGSSMGMRWRMYVTPFLPSA
jgi:hypothetical protein